MDKNNKKNVLTKQHHTLYLIFAIFSYCGFIVFAGLVGYYGIFAFFMILFAGGAVAFTILSVKTRNQIKAVKIKYKNVGINPEDVVEGEPVIPPLVDEFDKTIRWNFPKLPLDDYRIPLGLLRTLEGEISAGKPSTITLQSILIDMEHHIDLKLNKSIIVLEKLEENKAGIFERKDWTFSEITVGYCDIYDAKNYLAVLAHELSHAYQHSFNKHLLFDKDKQELFTDFLTFYLGFGDLTKRGKVAKKVDNFFDKTRTRTATIGYLDKSYFPYIESAVGRLLKDKENSKREIIENQKAKKKIEELLELSKYYFEIIQGQLDQLVHAKLSNESFSKVQELFMKYDKSFILEITSKTNDYEKQKSMTNKVTVKTLEKVIEEMIKDSQSLQQILEE